MNSIAGYFKEQRCTGTRFEHLLSGTMKSTNRLNYLPLWDAWPFYQRNLTQAFQWFIERRYLKLTIFCYSMIIFFWKGLSYIFLGLKLQRYPGILFAFGWNWAQWFWTRFSYYNGRLSTFWQEYGFLFEDALCWVCCAFHHIASVIILNEVDGLHL